MVVRMIADLRRLILAGTLKPASLDPLLSDRERTANAVRLAFPGCTVQHEGPRGALVTGYDAPSVDELRAAFPGFAVAIAHHHWAAIVVRDRS